MAPSTTYRACATALFRAVSRPTLSLPSFPDLDDCSVLGHEERLAWLRQVWAEKRVAEALEHASSGLASQVRALCAADAPSIRDVRRAVSTVARYVIRAEHRPTPFGFFAGVATASFGRHTRVQCGTEHTVVSRAGAEWTAAVADRLESIPEVLDLLAVVVNTVVAPRDGRLIVPYQSDCHGDDERAVEASIGLTKPVRTVMHAAHTPIQVGTLLDKTAAEFPHAAPEAVRRLVLGLIHHRVLLTNLRAPSTETDAFAHVMRQLDAMGSSIPAPAALLVRELDAVRTGLRTCSDRESRDRVAGRMCALVPGLRRHPLALDLRLDADIELPEAVARDVERAAQALTRLSAMPYGTEAWKAYQRRFYERYGIGTMVPLKEVVADSGTGFPDGYPGTPPDRRRRRLSERDDVLVGLAQAAALDGCDEVVLTDELIASLDIGPEHPRVPPHLEVGVRVLAASTEELHRGRFRLEVVSVSRGIGVSTGRFLSVLGNPEREALTGQIAELPTADSGTVAAQLSFPPLLPSSGHVTRAPQVLPLVVSVQEHRAPGSEVLTPNDLAVACDGRRMYLAAPGRGHRVEAVGMHALNLRKHTPPLVRFLTELSRAQCAQVTLFDWGAANAMPFLPRLRYGRVVLAPARWRLKESELPGTNRPRAEWDAVLDQWRARRRLPQQFFLTEGDRRLLLDLDRAAHRALLRQHLVGSPVAVLVEAPAQDDHGWCEGRAHEVVVPLKATQPAPWPTLPAPSPARLFSPAQIQSPGTASLLLATLYGDARRQDDLLATHLPALLAQLGNPPWWFVRFRDPEHHLRVRIALPSPDAFAETAGVVSAWAGKLRGAGLLSDLRFPTSYREMGRWGSGAAWSAAENVFRADSKAVVAQLSEARRPQRRTLTVAHTIAIATEFLGSTAAGMRWLIKHIPRTAPAAVPRTEFTEVVRLANPSENWTALQTAPGGQTVVAGWAQRTTALAAYRPHLPGPDTQGIALDDVLSSLLHVHFVRHVGIDFEEEAICLYLARAAALAWTRRTT
ncbi:lantibiotic dehydratase [Streptomyces sp. NPDC051561]|uniref:lantibiotic dehydratase n=1 Tax=Streptomyces sp. NPDC051561 TaxID=3365658 RepID=UPI0037AB2D1C